jgi:DNA-binding MarR family transcriptional regulator
LITDRLTSPRSILTSRTVSTSRSQREVIQANGQDGSMNRATAVSMDNHYSFRGNNIVNRWRNAVGRRSDPIDVIVSEWRRERPDLDAAPLLVVGRISRLAAALDDALRPPFRAARLNPGDFDLLAALRRAGPPFTRTAGELAEAMLVTNGAATKRVDRLQRRGLVRRSPSADDARSRLVSLTAAGAALVDRMIAVHLANERAILDALSPRQLRELERLLRLLARSLDDAGTG